MKKLFLLVSALFLLTSFVHAQFDKTVYAELGGPGLASINYDMRFTKNPGGIGGRIGVGGFRIDDVAAVLVPVGVNYLIGKNNRNYFELGAGVTFVNVQESYDRDGAFRTTFGHISFGYRLQPATSSFMFRAAIVPIFNSDFFWPFYAGVGLGYKF